MKYWLAPISEEDDEWSLMIQSNFLPAVGTKVEISDEIIGKVSDHNFSLKENDVICSIIVFKRTREEIIKILSSHKEWVDFHDRVKVN